MHAQFVAGIERVGLQRRAVQLARTDMRKKLLLLVLAERRRNRCRRHNKVRFFGETPPEYFL